MVLFDIEVPDLLVGVDRGTVGAVECYDDVYTAFGKVTHQCNLWEKKYKEYTEKRGFVIKKDASLWFTHKQFKGYLDDDVFNKIENVIKVRNHFEHEFLLDIFKENYGEQRIVDFNEIKNVMDLCYNLFCEGIDFVDNLIDALDLSGTYYAKRPTIFDK